jgi:localization factor PodJL
MRPDLPWNVAGISTEAREAARAAARREGLSVGEWLTRRIVSGLSDMSEPRPDWRQDYRVDPERQRRDSDAMLERVSKSETETAEVYRRIEDQLRNMARRLDASERSQTESNRVMSKAAVEMNIAAREQSQAFDQLGSNVSILAERLSRVEHRENGDGMREAVKALHQGLSRLADQITETANQSATQISNLASNLETVAGRVGQARQDAQGTAKALEAQLGTLEDRLRILELNVQTAQSSASQALEAIEAQKSGPQPMDAIGKLEDSLKNLESRESEVGADRRLAGIERALAEVTVRIEQQATNAALVPLEESVRKIATRLEALEASQREAEEAKKSAELPPQLPPQAVPPMADPANVATPFPTQTFVVPPPPFVPPPAATGAAQKNAPSDATNSSATGSIAGFEPPPFVDPAPPPFAATASHASQSASGFTDPLPNYELPPETFVAPPPEAPTVESYLAAARRSARAAAQQEAERASSLGSLRWGSAAKTPEPAKPRTRPFLIGLLALTTIAVIAAVMLSNQLNHPSPVFPPVTKQPVTEAVKADLPPAPDMHAAEEATPAAMPAASTPPANKQTAPAPANAPATKPNQQAAALPQPASQPAPQATRVPASLERLTQAANTGNARAQLLVGLKYLDGDGVAANDAEAAKWLGKAADAGEAVAQYRLGTLYERGRGVPADSAKAARWYQAAATQGSRKAMHNLAVAYTEGAGVKKDYAEASRWFLRAANLGLSDSQFNLAVLYERGMGVPQNLVDAYKWYAIAASQGDAESKTRLNAISGQLDGEAKAAAQHAAEGFKPAPLDAKANVAPTSSEATRG